MELFEKVIMGIMMVIIIGIFAMIIIAIGSAIYSDIDYGVKEGIIIDKQYNREFTTTTYTTTYSGDTQIIIPVQQYHPESYTIKIQKEEGQEVKEIWINVTPSEYEKLNIGDYYGR